MNKLTLPLLLLCLAVPFAALASCTKHEDPKGTPTPNAGSTPVDDHGHGTAKPLGSMTIGAHTFEVVQFGDVKGGAETAVELQFAKGKTRPGTVRGWIGVESGEGSRKDKFGNEGDTALHGHLQAPATLPAGSKLWIEIEDGGKTQTGSVAWK